MGNMAIQGRMALIFAFALAGCGAFDDPPLPGQRIGLGRDAPAPTGALSTAPRVQLGTARTNSEWAQEAGNAARAPGHVALRYPLTLAWHRTGLAGSSNDTRLIAAPVVAGGRVFTLDTASMVTAHDQNGTALWSRSLVPAGENPRDGVGGGIAVSGDILTVGTGFGVLHALSSRDGAPLWQQKLTAPISAAPAIAEGKAIVVTRDDRAYGIDLKNGRIRWRIGGVAPEAGIFGGASPAAAGGVAVLPFGSGELAGLRIRNGQQLWGEQLAGGRRGAARGRFDDITGDPVILGQRVYAANQSGKLAALDRESGNILWQVREGSFGPAAVAGSDLWIITDQGQLQRRRTADGALVWSVGLPIYRDPEDRDGFIIHHGPVLAGGRLLVASADGQMRSFDPASGQLLDAVSLPAGAAAAPAIAAGQVYVLTVDGGLAAYR